MSIFDLFKSKWLAVKMSEEDRKKIFWYVKRKTSYTAWKREADIFDRFADVFEKQIREQPHAPGLMGGTDWPPFHSKVIKAQVYYEQALDRLLTGDRTIFLYNGRGVMVDATTLSEYWYTELVNHGARGDHFYDGKYVPAMTALMHEFSDACDARGYLQPMMSDTPAPELWTTFWYDDYVKYGIPDDVPDVPPATNIIVKTGEVVPVFGIYEPQIKDGCMNYLLAGVVAPTIWESDGTEATDNALSVSWRLVWEDTRYIDGTIPAEERSYFPRSPRPGAVPLAADFVDDTLSALTGDLCVRSGTWAVIDDLNGKIIMVENEKFPQYKGGDTMWVWVAT
jgi:hypothetical protein